MTICLVDTSILDEVLNVPDWSHHHQDIMDQLRKLITEGSTELLLPFAAIVETGNHIAQAGDGRQRRVCAKRFIKQVTKALDGQAPWTVTPMPEPVGIRDWLADFPDAAMRGLGIADLSIIAEWKRQCSLWSERRDYIWSLDEHLRSYDSKS